MQKYTPHFYYIKGLKDTDINRSWNALYDVSGPFQNGLYQNEMK